MQRILFVFAAVDRRPQVFRIVYILLLGAEAPIRNISILCIHALKSVANYFFPFSPALQSGCDILFEILSGTLFPSDSFKK